jgi:plastocyanin
MCFLDKAYIFYYRYFIGGVMSYTWSPSVTITVLAQLGISSVELVPNKTTAYVGDTVNFKVRVTFNRQTTTADTSYTVTTVLAINSQTNIVSMWSEYIKAGITTYEYTHSYKFTSAGQYTVWGGAKITGPTAYTPLGYGYLMSNPVVITVLPYEVPQGFPSPSILGDVALFTLGAITGAFLYKSWREGKLRLPKLR